ncbi:hypothetical protein [Streptomyces sp. NPDC049906]|uniref:hypothetical protein n=1 Tax=Streptomyces sp. NPDC049906 TaxID=3155656 RepID=UPI0034356EE1
MTGVRRRWAAGAAGVLLGLSAAGCGIRPTEVPTDFGSAPSRTPCAVSEPPADGPDAAGVPMRVFLVCASQLTPVQRRVELPAEQDAGQSAERAAGKEDRGRVARALLEQLALPMARAERQAGYTTDVPDRLVVTGPQAGDPRDALRLSAPVAGLAPFALAQLVCTLANSAAAAHDGRVVLGGPGDSALHAYECTPEVRARPGSHGPPRTEVRSG